MSQDINDTECAAVQLQEPVLGCGKDCGCPYNNKWGAVRELRLYHWRLALRLRAAQEELEVLATSRKSGSLKSCIKTYKDGADLHLTAVQTLNQFFPIGDTAEKDNA